jgi:hypothetical protein
VGLAGDTNGDGYSDVLVADTGRQKDFNTEGVLFLYFGNNGPGVSLAPRQRLDSDSGPIARLGRSDEDAFKIKFLAKSPFGRTSARLEWEVKPFGILFNGSSTGVSSSGTDTGTSGAPITGTSAELTADSLYHWRARLRYSPASNPFSPHSRWMTQPWNGWQEADVRSKE